MIYKSTLENLYLSKKLSMMDISKELNCSHNKVAYWMKIYNIPRRSIGEAIYGKHNPDGDPFKMLTVLTPQQAELFGLGLGLYWGEGTKADKYAVRLGNSDPALLLTFMKFLTEIFGVSKEKFKYGLQIFTDINEREALEYWCGELGANPSQFYKVYVTISGSIGTYRTKSKYGVVTVYFHNKKLRDILVGLLPR